MILFFTFLVLLQLSESSPYDYPSSVQKHATSLGKLKVTASPKTVQNTFDNFALTHYSFLYDPIYSEQFGSALYFVDTDADLVWISMTSACFGFTTSIFSYSYVKYGPTETLGSKSSVSKRHHFSHLVHLRDLKINKQYYYQICVYSETLDELCGEMGNFTTLEYNEDEYRYIKQSDIPVSLNEDHKHYILAEDIRAVNCGDEWALITVSCVGCTLDLNGKTVSVGRTNDDICQGVSFNVMNNPAYYGTVINGKIMHIEDSKKVARHVKSTDKEHRSTLLVVTFQYRSDYILADYTVLRAIVEGLKFQYWFPHSDAVTISSPVGYVIFRHNYLYDKGTVIDNRSSGRRAVTLNSCVFDHTEYNQFHHNVLARHRHWAVTGFDILFDNEVYVDSWTTNGFALYMKSFDVSCYNNKIFITVYKAITDDKTVGLDVYDNFIHMEVIDTGNPSVRHKEYIGDSCSGIRLTNYSPGGQLRENVRFSNNVIIGWYQGGAGGKARGYQVMTDFNSKDNFIENTYVRMLTRKNSEVSVLNTAVSTEGQSDNDEYVQNEGEIVAPLYYYNSHLISDIVNVNLGDGYYGGGDHHYFQNVTIRRLGDLTEYHPYVLKSTSDDIRFINCCFDDIDYMATINTFSKPHCSALIYFTLSVYSQEGDTITVINSYNETVDSGTVSGGVYQIDVLVFKAEALSVRRQGWPLGTYDYNDFEVRSQLSGQKQIVTITEPKCIEFPGGNDEDCTSLLYCADFDYEKWNNFEITSYNNVKEKKGDDDTLMIIIISVGTFLVCVFLVIVVGIIVYVVFKNKDSIKEFLKPGAVELKSSDNLLPVVESGFEEDLKSVSIDQKL